SAGVAGANGLASGVCDAEAGLGSEVPTALVATTVKVYATLLVRPSTVHVVLTQSRVIPPGCAVTRYPVLGSPLLAGASQASTTVRSRTSAARGAEGAAGRPRTVRVIRPSTRRSGSPVTSSTLYRVTICPMKPSA